MQKTDASAFINQVLVYTLMVLVFTGSIGLGTVWLRHEISVVANRNQRLQAQLADVQPRPEQSEYVRGDVERRLLARRNQDLFTVEVQPAVLRRGNPR
jgi:hypothetical protein